MLKFKNDFLHNKYLVLIFFGLAIIAASFAALIISSPNNTTKAATITSDLEVQVNQMLELNVTNCDSTNSSVVNIDVIPSTTGTFNSNCQNVSVDTNSPGYTLSVKAASTTLDYLNPTSVTPKPAISPTSSLVLAPSTLPNDTWGFAAENRLNFDSSYTIDNAANKYAAITTTDTLIHTEGFPIITNDHEFFYAARLTPATMAGSYMTTVTYTAVGEVIPKVYLSDVVAITNTTTMQQLTTGRCGMAEYDPSNGGINNNNTVVLNDTRNNQQYRVRKMPDNKCWMIDNIKLANRLLTPEDSNVTSNYNLMAISATHGTDDDTPYVDDPAINSTLKDNCINNTGIDGFTEAYSSDSLTGCGYLYSFSAATAGTGDGLSVDGQNATGSICSAGWRLPTGTSTGDFAILNGSMINGSLSAASTEDSSASRANWFSTGKFSGSYAGYFSGSSWNNQGFSGSWWSSTVSSGTSAYRAGVNYGYLSPGTGTHNQYYGFSVRCVL